MSGETIDRAALSMDEIRAKAMRFARGRCTAHEFMLGPDRGLEYRFAPKVAGLFVRNADDPQEKFTTPEEALAAARRFRDSCRAYLAKRGDVW